MIWDAMTLMCVIVEHMIHYARMCQCRTQIEFRPDSDIYLHDLDMFASRASCVTGAYDCSAAGPYNHLLHRGGTNLYNVKHVRDLKWLAIQPCPSIILNHIRLSLSVPRDKFVAFLCPYEPLWTQNNTMKQQVVSDFDRDSLGQLFALGAI